MNIDSDNTISYVNQVSGLTKELILEGSQKVYNHYKPIAAATRRQLGIYHDRPLVHGTEDYAKVASYVYNKYHTPGSPGYNPKLTQQQRSAAYWNEQNVTLFGDKITKRGEGLCGLDPLFGEDGLKVFYGGDEENYQYGRNTMSEQIRSLFAKNNILIPLNTKLRFSINPYNFLISVTGTEDTDLISRIEKTLNNGDNGMVLFEYLLFSPYDNAQMTNEQKQKFWMFNYVRYTTGLTNMSEMQVVDGRFITTDGKDLITLLERETIDKNASRDLPYIKELLGYFARTGYNAVPSVHLQVEWQNGELVGIFGSKPFDVKA